MDAASIAGVLTAFALIFGLRFAVRWAVRETVEHYAPDHPWVNFAFGLLPVVYAVLVVTGVFHESGLALVKTWVFAVLGIVVLVLAAQAGFRSRR